MSCVSIGAMQATPPTAPCCTSSKNNNFSINIRTVMLCVGIGAIPTTPPTAPCCTISRTTTTPSAERQQHPELPCGASPSVQHQPHPRLLGKFCTSSRTTTTPAAEQQQLQQQNNNNSNSSMAWPSSVSEATTRQTVGPCMVPSKVPVGREPSTRLSFNNIRVTEDKYRKLEPIAKRSSAVPENPKKSVPMNEWTINRNIFTEKSLKNTAAGRAHFFLKLCPQLEICATR
ncbi:uncharacterized protein LOC129739603 isoform X1 [Uranotaenia lowii]|uniref:uncharacterized protein LOC129739603 isoform X1 n=1 Tax=Uranotaenia lowii TaxID=190385 RepID=UPI00247ACDF4|nr:uncharacterized protein LOC129739603 isoform X1 [Uranotaenia lowii]XP_055587055.1 uncharacterized protein LOC129739603 isoform X1 [Uranotaenia lowii]